MPMNVMMYIIDMLCIPPRRIGDLGAPLPPPTKNPANKSAITHETRTVNKYNQNVRDMKEIAKRNATLIMNVIGIVNNIALKADEVRANPQLISSPYPSFDLPNIHLISLSWSQGLNQAFFFSSPSPIPSLIPQLLPRCTSSSCLRVGFYTVFIATSLWRGIATHRRYAYSMAVVSLLPHIERHTQQPCLTQSPKLEMQGK